MHDKRWFPAVDYMTLHVCLLMHRTKCTKCGLMTNGPDDILQLDYKLDISHFLFTEQELPLWAIFYIQLSFIKVEETITQQQTEKNRRKKIILK